MPYLTAPPWAKISDRTILTLAYFAVAGMGLLSTLGRDSTTSIVVGWTLLATSVLCAAGAISGRWEVEAIGLWPLIATLLGSLVLADIGPRHVVWWMILALSAQLLRQWLRMFLQIIAHLRRRRLLHRLSDGGSA